MTPVRNTVISAKIAPSSPKGSRRRRFPRWPIAAVVGLAFAGLIGVKAVAVMYNRSMGAVLHRGGAYVLGAVGGVRPSGGSSEPAPVPARPLTDSARARIFVSLVGPYVPVWAAAGLGQAFGRYERDFVTYDERQWAATGPSWADIDYYDRAAIYYARYARTGDLKYLTRANAVAVDYRTKYLEANNYAIQAHWSMLDGVALHYLATGDEKSRTAVGKVADLFTGLAYRDNIGRRSETDNRVQARYLVALLLADAIGAPSVGIGAPVGLPGGHNWKAELRRALPLVLATQDKDGAWRPACRQTKPVTHPFTTGLLFDALARYYDLFEPDPRIPPAIKAAADYLWASDWMPTARAFKYVGARCAGEGEPVAAPDLNNLIVNGFAWTYKQSGDVVYRRRADEIFAGAIAGAWINPAKQFNQVYSSSHRYHAYTRPELARETAPRFP